MTIDLHAHTTIHRLWELHTETATIGDLEKEAEKHGIKRIVLMATYFPFKNKGLHNLELLRRIEGHPLFLAFGSLDVMNDLRGGLIELELLARQKRLAGIKLYPGYQDFDPAGEDAEAVYRLAEKYGLPVMFHGGDLHGCCPSDDRAKGIARCRVCYIDQLQHLSNPLAMKAAALRHPETEFVISHLGTPFFKELREVMSECPNVSTDMSGLFVSGRSEWDNPTYHAEVVGEMQKMLALPNGTDRLCFATDFPIQSYASTYQLLNALGLDAATERKVLSGNALRILKLEEV